MLTFGQIGLVIRSPLMPPVVALLLYQTFRQGSLCGQFTCILQIVSIIVHQSNVHSFPLEAFEPWCLRQLVPICGPWVQISEPLKAFASSQEALLTQRCEVWCLVLPSSAINMRWVMLSSSPGDNISRSDLGTVETVRRQSLRQTAY